MAILEMNYYSMALGRTTTVNVILPTDKALVDGYTPIKPFKTLYLLHGYCGNHTDWVNYTRIQHLAEDRNLAVVMPAGENAFYIDHPYGKFGQLIGEELVQMTRRMFPLSHRREDTFIAGLSMGGYGAMRNGLKYADTFGYIGAFSGAFHYFALEPEQAEESHRKRNYLFGDPVEAAKTDVNPQVAYLNRTADPKIYMACGTEDELLESSRRFHAFLQEQGADVTYEEGPGAHNWDFWNTYLLKFLNWLPLDGKLQGIGSGNVK